MKEITCAVLGHHASALPFGFNEADEKCVFFKSRLKEEIVKLIEKDHVSRFISGMALGTDMYAAEIILSLKKSYPGISLECAIPYEEQPKKWTEAFRDRYFDIAYKCDRETLLQKKFTGDCMEKRNRYMVDSSDILLAVYEGLEGETSNAIDYAKSLGREVSLLDPTAVEVGIL